jgi:hypothetical protein
MARIAKSVPAWALMTLSVVAVVHAPLAAEKDPNEEKVTRAMRAGPRSIAKDATIADIDGTVLREGTNGWTCMPGIAPGDEHPMCNDEVWMRLMQAMEGKAAFQTDRIGISYMLAGDAYVSNSDPFATDPNNGDVWVQEGPHLMILVPNPKMLEGVPDDPFNGGPYVMWKDTPYAHIMVPIGPELR